jgi:alkyl sulfatase BDS1-like metallo-beta-lactamase superfamily hydrolase
MAKRRLPITLVLIAFLLPASFANALNLYKPGDTKGTVGGCGAGGFSENLAYDKPSKTIPASLTKHSKTMCKMVIEIVPDRVYLAWGYALASPTLIIGDDGLIAIDPPDSMEATKLAWDDLLEAAKTDLPVKAVIYTHSHPDHFPGIRYLVDEKDVDAGKVKIIAQETFMANIVEQNSVLGPILGIRSAFSAGDPILSPGPEGRVNAGLGPLFFGGELTLIPPTELIPTDGQRDFEIAGVKMTVRHTPGDIYDNITTWFPEWKIYHFAEVLQGENFPNLHTIRGTRYRDPQRWFQSIDGMREAARDAEILIGSHGRPVFGKTELNDVLTSYRDAIQYTHDQTIRYMNRGMTPDELVEVVKLPPHLANHPWLGEFYGTVEHSVRQIYVGLLGFWEGDMTAMAKPPYRERAQAYVKIMGGRKALLAEARKAIDAGNYGWAADITTWPIRVDPTDMEARKVKAEALRKWGLTVESINWRHNALIGAAELETEGTLPNLTASAKALFGAADVIAAIPPGQVIENLQVQLQAERTLDVQMTLGIRITDLDEAYALEIRRGICEFHEKVPKGADVVIELTKADVIRVLTRQTTFAASAKDGTIEVKEGSAADVARFFDYFETPDPNAIRLIAR